MVVLITGGTGFFGQHMVKYLLQKPEAKKIIIYSRDEHKQELMSKKFNSEKLRFFIGDVRDRERLNLAMRGVDKVIHAAALKVVPILEYNPSEAIKTNTLGTDNVLHACVQNGVKQATMISTDKAVEPINLYGASKAAAEKLWIEANAYMPIFDVCRFGNVMGSTGSVLNVWRELLASNKETPIPVTDVRMTRFWLSVHDAVRFVYEHEFIPGAINIPDMKAFEMIKLASALYKRCNIKEVGIRRGEKLHETIISSNEWRNCKKIDYRSIRYYRLHTDYVNTEEMVSITSKNAEHMNAIDLKKELEKL